MFKILRWGSDVTFFINKEPIVSKSGFSDTVAFYRIYNGNLTAASNVTCYVNYFKERLFTVFGNNIDYDTTGVSYSRARGTTPHSLTADGIEAGYAGNVNVYAVTSAGIYPVRELFDYYYEDKAISVSSVNGNMKFSMVSDNSVKTPFDKRKGF